MNAPQARPDHYVECLAFQPVMAVSKIAQADGVVKADGPLTLFNEEFELEPASVLGDAGEARQQEAADTEAARMLEGMEIADHRHGLAAPAGITAIEGDEADGFCVALGDQGLEQRIGPEAVLAQLLGGRPLPLAGQMILGDAAK